MTFYLSQVPGAPHRQAVIPQTVFDPAATGYDWSEQAQLWKPISEVEADVPRITVAGSGAVIQVMDSTTTPAQLKTAIAAGNQDIIKLTAGTYSNFFLVQINVNRSARPLLIQGEGSVIFDGTGSGGDGCFYFGYYGLGLASYIQLDNLKFQNYTIFSSGVTVWGQTDHLSMTNCSFTNNHSGDAIQRDHHIYVGTDNTGLGGSSNLYMADITVVCPAGAMTGLHAFHDPNLRTGTFKRFNVSGGYRGALMWTDGTNVTLDGWTITNMTRSVDFSGQTGIVTNTTATGSSVARAMGSMVDGPGNSWDL